MHEIERKFNEIDLCGIRVIYAMEDDDRFEKNKIRSLPEVENSRET